MAPENPEPYLVLQYVMILNNLSNTRLTKQRKNILVALVSLSQHGCTCLSKDVVVGVFNHLCSHICITNLAFSGCCILNNVIQVVNCVLKSVLNCTKAGSLFTNILNCIFNRRIKSLCFRNTRCTRSTVKTNH